MTVYQPPEGYVALDESQKVFKKILVQGQGETASRPGSTLTVHYTGVLENGEKFDSSVDRDDHFIFEIGRGQVIKGWDVGMATMKVGEKAELLILPEYGYGVQGSPPKIPGNSILIFTVEVFNIDLSTADMTVQESLDHATPLKEKGNEYFKKGESEEAIKCYKQAADSLAKQLNATGKEAELVKQLNISLYSNISACYLKTKQAKEAVEYAGKVLSLEPTHPKALYRLSQGQLALGEYNAAIQTLTDNKSILVDVDVEKEIVRIKATRKHQEAAEKKLYSRMFA